MMPHNATWLALGVVFGLSCAPTSDPYPELAPEPRPAWVLRITSHPGNTMTARVEDTSTRRAIRVYAGQAGALPLGGTDGRRQVAVQVGPYTFVTADFIPSDAFPCWELFIDAGPPFLQARSGPYPCREQYAPKARESAAQAPDTAVTRREIERLVGCFASEFQLFDWEIELVFVHAPDTVWAGRTGLAPNPPDGPHYAEVSFELHWLSRSPEAIRPVVLHEMLHVVTAAFYVGLHDAAGGPFANQVAEYVTQRMVRWPLWGRVCR